MNQWRVMPIPQGSRNALMTVKPGATEEETQEIAENLGGVTIYIGTSDLNKQEFCRVGYIRRVTKNPDTPFDQEFKARLADADALVAEINTRLDAEVPEITTKLEELSNKLAEQANALDQQAASLATEVRTQLGEVGNRINNLAGEIISKMTPPEGLL